REPALLRPALLRRHLSRVRPGGSRRNRPPGCSAGPDLSLPRFGPRIDRVGLVPAAEPVAGGLGGAVERATALAAALDQDPVGPGLAPLRTSPSSGMRYT